MSDIIDRANDLASAYLTRSIDQHRDRPRERPLLLDGVRVCRLCEEPIAPERLRAAPDAVRCVHCQALTER